MGAEFSSRVMAVAFKFVEKEAGCTVDGCEQTPATEVETYNHMSFNQELASLPHGPEFRFLHEVTALVPGKSGEATYRISGEEDFLKGHFPGQPIWPGVILLEAIAQLGGVVAQSDPALAKLADVRLTSVKNAKILGTATPGETLVITAQVEGRMGPLIQISGSVTAPAGKICSAMVMLSGTEMPESHQTVV